MRERGTDGGLRKQLHRRLLDVIGSRSGIMFVIICVVAVVHTFFDVLELTMSAASRCS